MKTSSRALAAALVAAAALALTGCDADLSWPDADGSDDMVDITAGPGVDAPEVAESERPASSAPDVIAADVTKVAQGYKKTHAKTGSYMDFDADTVTLTGDNFVATSASLDDGFLVCVVEPVTGAWALWESVDDAITQSGDTDSECGPTQPVQG